MGLYQWRLMISLAAARDHLDRQPTVARGGRTTRRPAQRAALWSWLSADRNHLSGMTWFGPLRLQRTAGPALPRRQTAGAPKLQR
jgi:hypothetical protein